MEALLFYIFAMLTFIGAAGVLLSTNIVRMAVQLLVALLGVAGLYISLAAEFLAAVQFVIYVGGTLVLIIFGVMLTARASTIDLKTKPIERVFGVLSGLVLFAGIMISILKSNFIESAPRERLQPMQQMGYHLLGDYMLPFELSSLLLLAVMIGAAYLARRPSKRKDH